MDGFGCEFDCGAGLAGCEFDSGTVLAGCEFDCRFSCRINLGSLGCFINCFVWFQQLVTFGGTIGSPFFFLSLWYIINKIIATTTRPAIVPPTIAPVLFPVEKQNIRK